MATLPLQDPTLAVAELERASKLGVRSVEIGASIHQRELDDPALDPFWAAAERLGVLVFVHPVRPPGRERMQAYHLFNLIGFLAETTLAAARMIFAGVLDKHPRLNVCLAHTGGMLLWIEGRFDQAYVTIEACRKDIERKPSEYLTRFYYDTIAYRPRALAYAAESVGASRIMLGTDYPFASVNAVPGLSAQDRTSMLGGAAAALLGLEKVHT
jgi:aminocarboxymuconate-semialdehyde decarboxylase